MKTIRRNTRYAFLILTCALWGGCDDFIDKAPVDQVSREDFFKTPSNVLAAANGMYQSMGHVDYLGRAFIVVPGFAAGHMRSSGNLPEYVEIQDHRIRTDNPHIFSLWTSMYRTINAANNIIAFVPEMGEYEHDEQLRQYVNEAKFIRAFNYFNLVRSWGKVPLLTNPTESADPGEIRVPRNEVEEVYDLIVQDLSDAGELPGSYESSELSKGRATSWAARALLAKVYLYREAYAEAAQLAKEVIDQGGFTLAGNYPSIWTAGNSAEAIFEFQFDTQLQNYFVQYANPESATQFFASNFSRTVFEEDDIRREFTVWETANTDGVTNLYIGKYRQYNPPTQNIPLIRLPEIYLLYAEAQARATGSPAGEPYAHYKAIRDRAGVETPGEGTFSLDSFTKAIQEERRREFMFEFETWYDYCRTGLALEELGVPNENMFLFPVPQQERDNNPQLDQNAGY